MNPLASQHRAHGCQGV